MIERRDVTIHAPPAVLYTATSPPDPTRQTLAPADLIAQLVQENRELRQKIEEEKITRWTLGRTATALAHLIIRGEVSMDEDGGILIPRDVVLMLGSLHLTIAETVGHDLIVRLSERAGHPVEEAV